MKKYLVNSIILFVFSLLSLFFLFFLPKNLYSKSLVFLLVFVAVCFFLYLGFWNLSQYQNDKKYMNLGLKVYFGVYLFLLYSLTVFLRNDHPFLLFQNIRFDDLFSRMNLIPFSETMHLISDVIVTKNYSALFLIIGNIFVFIPLSYFLPRILKQERHPLVFLSTVVLISISIEFLQLITSSGTFDIDDIIYNSAGAFLFFKLFQTSVGSVLDSILLGQNKKISKEKCFWALFILMIVIVSLCFTGYFYLYYDSASVYEASIINTSKECLGEKEYFYEDEFYRYYFPCQMGNDVFIQINENKKITKTLLKDYVKEHEDFSMISFVDDKTIFAEPKGYEISFTYFGYGKHVEYEIENPIVQIQKSIITDHNELIEYHFIVIPLQKGKTIVKFNIINIEGNVEETKKYQVSYDNEFKFYQV